MSMRNLSKSLKENGLVILKSNDLDYLNRVKKEYFKIAKNNGFDGSLKKLSHVSEKKLNKIHIDFNKKSKNCNFNLLNSFSKSIYKILGKKIFVQRQPYLRLKKYNLKSTATMPHNDYDFGHTHHGFNLWTPLFDMFNNEGIYMYDLNTSKKIYSSFKFNCHLSEHIKKNNFDKHKKYLNLKFGEAVFFSNLCIHGASVLKKKHNRASTNIHLQGFNVPTNEKSTELFTIGELQKNFYYKQLGI